MVSFHLCLSLCIPGHRSTLANDKKHSQVMQPSLPAWFLPGPCFAFFGQVSVVSRFYNSVEMEKFQVHTEAMMLMERME